jgi:hypothetical protein
MVDVPILLGIHVQSIIVCAQKHCCLSSFVAHLPILVLQHEFTMIIEKLQHSG